MYKNKSAQFTSHLGTFFLSLLVLLYSSMGMAANGFDARELKQVDAKVRAYMQKHNVPGLSFAISRHGKLVLQRAYGYADKEKAHKLSPLYRFRIASVSKPLTAIAIMKLVDMGKLRLNDQVFGRRGVLGNRYGKRAYGDWLKRITVKHLLTHTAGGWPNNGNDPMFFNKSWTSSQLITYTLDNLPLKNKPGTQYAYSNFGYSLLGRVIEVASGMDYEAFVTRGVLGPAGAGGMTVAGNTLADRHAMEVKYYHDKWPYTLNVTRMDAHGGWIATPTDLLKVLVRVDGFNSVPDMLPNHLIAQMYKPSGPSNGGYAKGWSVNSQPNYWHNGSLPGTLALLVRANDGFGWAAMTNARSNGDRGGGKLDRLMWKIRGTITRWPSHNLF